MADRIRRTHWKPLPRTVVFGAAAGACLLSLLGGCSYVSELKLPFITEQGSKLNQEGEAEGRVPVVSDVAAAVGGNYRPPMLYPGALPLEDPIDIEVVRSGNAIRLVNRSVRSYRDVEVWLNQDYGARLNELPIGASQPIDLESFVNRYGELYPVGRFLTPDRDQALVMAELVSSGRIHKITVRLGDDWRSGRGTGDVRVSSPSYQ